MTRVSSRFPGTWLGCLLLIVAAGLPASRALAQDEGFVGIVDEASVPVYAGASRIHYKVGEVEQGQRVEVRDIVFGWNRIEPPEGVYSYVEQAFVDAQGDGSAGIVNKDRVRVRPANLEGPGESYRFHAELSQGEQVRIVAEEGDYYRIVPPEGAMVYLPPGTVRRATDAEAEAQPQPRPQAEEQPADPEQPEEQPDAD
ncbi:MAG: SH3 domain-containing protein, partial [Phycisphaeraceae bacterium]